MTCPVPFEHKVLSKYQINKILLVHVFIKEALLLRLIQAEYVPSRVLLQHLLGLLPRKVRRLDEIGEEGGEAVHRLRVHVLLSLLVSEV